MSAYVDADYGPATVHPLDPRNESDDRDWPELSTAEQRERLANMSPAELVEQAVEFLFMLDSWQGRYARLCIRQGVENQYREKA